MTSTIAGIVLSATLVVLSQSDSSQNNDWLFIGSGNEVMVTRAELAWVSQRTPGVRPRQAHRTVSKQPKHAHKQAIYQNKDTKIRLPLLDQPCLFFSGFAGPRFGNLCNTPSAPQEQTPNRKRPAKPKQPVTNYHTIITQTLATTHIQPPQLLIQPPGGKALSLYPIIVAVPNNTQNITLTVNNTPVHIRLKATKYTTDWGDISYPTTTTKQPLPYPDQSLTHSYKPGTYQITLTTQWQATWTHPTTGEQITETTPLTTTQSQQIEIIQATPLNVHSDQPNRIR